MPHSVPIAWAFAEPLIHSRQPNPTAYPIAIILSYNLSVVFSYFHSWKPHSLSFCLPDFDSHKSAIAESHLPAWLSDTLSDVFTNIAPFGLNNYDSFLRCGSADAISQQRSNARSFIASFIGSFSTAHRCFRLADFSAFNFSIATYSCCALDQCPDISPDSTTDQRSNRTTIRNATVLSYSSSCDGSAAGICQNI